MMQPSRPIEAERGRATEERYCIAIDTSLGAVSICLWGIRSLQPAAAESMPMERGHAEALLPLLDRLVSGLDGDFSALARVAVTVGPGSFTGIRVGVAAARALGLACKIPVVGVSTLAALAAPLIDPGSDIRILAAIDARHGHVYAQGFSADGSTILDARHASAVDVIAAIGPGPLRLVGSGAHLLALEADRQSVETEVMDRSPIPDIALVARLGILADPEQSPPKPFYLKPPDAKPQYLPDPTQSPASAP